MEIGPITAVRPVSPVKPSRRDVDLSAVFAIELRKQNDEETDSSSHQKAARGLEEDDLQDDIIGEDDLRREVNTEDADMPPSSVATSNKISFFA